MYDIISLDSKELSEIREIAKSMNIPKVDKLEKQELIYKILDHQALNPTQEIIANEKKNVKRGRGRPPKVDKPRKEEEKVEPQPSSRPRQETPPRGPVDRNNDRRRDTNQPVQPRIHEPEKVIPVAVETSVDDSSVLSLKLPLHLLFSNGYLIRNSQSLFIRVNLCLLTLFSSSHHGILINP